MTIGSYIKTGLLASAVIIPAGIGGAWGIVSRADLYRGPIGIPGVQEVLAKPEYLPITPGLYDGNSIVITLDSGAVVTVRDFNGNLHFDGSGDRKDTIDGKLPPNLDLDRILTATRQFVRH